MEPHNDSTTGPSFSQGYRNTAVNTAMQYKHVQAMKHNVDCRLQLSLAAFKASMSMDRGPPGLFVLQGLCFQSLRESY